ATPTAATLPLGGDFVIHVGGLQAVAVLAIIVATLANCAQIEMRGQLASVLSSMKVLLIIGLGLGAFLFGNGDWSHFAQSGASGTCEGVAAAARGGLAGRGGWRLRVSRG